MRVLIVDDEALARLRLRSLIDDLSSELGRNGHQPPTLAADAADAEQALLALREQAADVVLLDIGLPGRGPHGGLKLAAALKALPQPPAVVFVTAHAEHALQAFELEALDYLTKPVRRDRLLAALQRVQQRMALLQGTAAAASAALVDRVLVVSDRGRVLRLPVREVLVLKAEQKYVTLRTATRTLVLDDPLADLERRLGADFVRIHRSTLVAVSAIQSLELRSGGGASASGAGGDATDSDGWAVQVMPLDEWLPVSRRQLAEVKAAIHAAGPQPPPA